jgi:hypothetical protein
MSLNSMHVMHFLPSLYTGDKECSLWDPFSSNCDQVAENETPDRSCQVLRVCVTGPPVRELTPMKMYASRNVLFSEGKFQLQDICYTIISSTEFQNLQMKCFQLDYCDLER